MNIINKLTLNHLKKNKKRTIVTIIGIAIAVALITSTITIVTSFVDLMKRDEIAQNGYWHVEYKNVDKDQVNKIKNDKNTEQVMLSRDIGFSKLESIENKSRPYIHVEEFDKQGFKNHNIKVLKGRLPENKNEIALSEDIFNNNKFNYSIGNTLNLDIGKRYYKDTSESEQKELGPEISYSLDMETIIPTVKKEYKIVGILENKKVNYNMLSGYRTYSYFDEGKTTETNISVILKNIKASTLEDIKTFANDNNIKSYVENKQLLEFSGAIDKEGIFLNTLIPILVIVLVIISLGSIALIYNAFSISVSERSKYLGILSSVGATKHQKRKSVLFEAMLMFLFGTPLGILIGLTGMGITFTVINSIIKEFLYTEVGLKLYVNCIGIVIIIITSAITIFLSALIPALKASKITAIEAIRQNKEVKLSRKKVKTSKFTRKVFGIEADIALKNLKRNKGKYLVTIFSLIISVVLFISVSFFGSIIKKSIGIYSENIDYDIEVSSTKVGALNTDDFKKEFESILKKSEDYTINNKIEDLILVEESKIPNYITNEYESFNNKKGIYAKVISLNEESFNKYCSEININPLDYNSEDSIKGIYLDTINYFNEEEKKYTEKKSIKFNTGDLVSIGNTHNEKEFKKISDIEIKKVTNKIPIGVEKPDNYSPIVIIVSEKNMNTISNNRIKVFGDEVKGEVALFIKTKDPIKMQEDLNIIKEQSSVDFNINNFMKEKQDQEKMVMVSSIFLYGFIALITLVSTANIFNTISTSIMLRRKEFAMLKSVGMSEKSFNKMINYESIFYGLKSLLYGLPLGLVITFLMYRQMAGGFDTSYDIPWVSLIIASLGVFLIVSISMIYASSKIKKENIIDAISQDNI